MASSLKIWGILLALLCILCRLLVHRKDVSWREFMKQHHISPSREFSEYKCNVLMREQEALKDKSSHVFIYISWYQIEHICNNGNWKGRYRNTYVWVQNALKVLKCHQENDNNGYTESRSFNYIEFHCGMDGYADSIEDLKMVQPIND
ncbi:PREDICTED: LOW QUALITY PROTEIN: epididymal secretory protein E3-beta-like [Propithecus coquereli]|uniref:LOW QUALITY PROTEIN: epididymal secretory protein E3-beta-like n=1 Tax=Propithecus coquereli TaxID=379532 RepID=UPI00063F9CA4|nr:PREDICTED: LOW QUALITY PROTEIN: epididymal secretory protein E3-beta-like [Propithecus coquereli]